LQFERRIKRKVIAKQTSIEITNKKHKIASLYCSTGSYKVRFEIWLSLYFFVMHLHHVFIVLENTISV